MPGEALLRALWQRLQECTDLRFFEDWPLLPTSTGTLYRMARRCAAGSRVLRDAPWWTPELRAAIHKAGCLVVSGAMTWAEHPALGAYVHAATAGGLLAALRNVAVGGLAGVPLLLVTATVAERRALRAFLCQLRWFEGPEALSSEQCDVMRHLAVFETYGGGSAPAEGNGDVEPRFVGLHDDSQPARMLPPAETEEVLLSDRFLRADNVRQGELMSQFLGVPLLSRVDFLKRYVFQHVEGMEVELRNRTMQAVLRDLPALQAQDRTMQAAVSQLRFVPTPAGGLQTYL
eukprot:gene5340-6483_t